METIEKKRIDPTQVNGWGVDTDPKNDPTYPIKARTNGEHAGSTWERPPQQRTDVEILRSNERPNVTAVFGTSTPPSGLSGALRRFAFNYSENMYRHWLFLMAADRIGMVEADLGDLAHGHVPNMLAERGWKAEWEYNRADLVTRVAVYAIATGAVIALLRRRNDQVS